MRYLATVFCLLGLTVSAAQIDRVDVTTTTGAAFPRDVVMANINSLPGTEFNPDTLSQDIERLYGTGYVDDVEAQVTEVSDGRLAITFVVAPVPRVREIVIQGNVNIKEKAVRRALKVEAGELLNRRQVAEDATAVRNLYEEKSYYDTSVTAYERPVPETGEVDLVIDIQETPRYKVGNVAFTGNILFSDRKLRDVMRTRHTFWSRFFAAGFYNEDEFELDRLRLAQFYAEQGYLDFRVTDVEKTISANGKWISLVIHVYEGEPYSVDEIRIEGNRLFGEAELREVIKLAAGSTYDSVREAADCRAIEQKYRPLGYIDMGCRPVLDKDTEAHTVDITYQVQEGVASRIRDIYISGNRVTKDEVIRRELRVLPGDLADANRIEASRIILHNLQYFDTVSIAPRSTEEEGLKDVDVTVSEKRTGQMLIGAGISSEDAIVGTFEISQNNFDIAGWPHFTGGGQRLRLRLQVGTERDEFLLSFIEPWWLDRRLRLETNAFRTNRDQEEYDQTNTGIDVSVTWLWREFWRQSLGYRIQQVSLDNFADDASAELLAEEGDYTSSTLLYSLSRDTRNYYANPTQGSRFQLNLELQGEAAGAYSNIYKLGVEMAKWYALNERTVLRLDGEIGVVDDLSGDPVAIFDRFFAGGSGSFRGFDRREISPVDANNDPVGGKSLLLGTVELTYAFTDVIRGSLFTDFGNVWKGAYDWDPADINVSVGVGLQFDLAIGPIRLDYGFPVVTQQDHLDTGGRLHFNLGYYF